MHKKFDFSPLQYGWKPLLVALATLVTGLSLTAYSLHLTQQGIRDLAQLEFRQYVDRLENAIQTQLKQPLYGLRGAIGAQAGMDATGGMRRANFRAYVAARDIATEFPGVRGFGYIEHVKRSELSRFEAAAKADGAPDFAVNTRGDAADLYVVKYIEPLAGNRAALGLDLGAESMRREAVERAIATGAPSLSGTITLAQDGRQGPGFLYLLPVYADGTTPDTPQARRAQLVGLFYSPLAAHELWRSAVPVTHGDVDFELFDDAVASPKTLVFSSQSALDARAGAVTPTDFAATRVFHEVRELVIGGRLLTLRTGSSALFDAELDHPTPLLVGGGGAALSLLLAAIVWLVLIGRARAETLARSMTTDLDRLAGAQKVAQQALTIERERLNNIIIGTHAGTWEWNVQTGELRINERWAEMIGYALQELTPASLQTWADHCHPDDLQPAKLLLAQHLAGSLDYFDCECRMRHRDGHWVWTHDRGKISTWTADGQPEWMSGTHLDISEQKLAEENLRHNNTVMQSILDNIPVGLSAFDSELVLIAKNRQFQTLLEFPDALFSGPSTTFESIIRFNADRGEYGEGDHEQTIQTIVERARRPKPHQFERLRPNRVALEVRGAPIPGGGFVTTYTDISERKRAEAEIARTTAMLQSVLDAASEVAVITTGLDRTITLFNTGAERMLGYTAAEVVGIHTPALFSDSEEVKARAAALSMELGRPVADSVVVIDKSTLGKKAEWTYIRKDGSRFVVALVITPLFDANGVCTGYLGISHDISTEKDYENWLRTALQEAEAATVAKSQFLANMSHEIRTPMNAILGMLKLLHNTELSPRQLDYASKTEGAAKSLLGLLNDILDFSKMEAGKMTLDPQPFRVDHLLRDLSVILSANVGKKPVEVLFDIDPATPQALIGDSMRLQQVLINLSGNAIKFTAQGEVVIQIKVLAQTGADTTLRFSVRDSGIGIAPENQQHIFDGFSQAEASTTRRFGGTGLGLSISKRLVALMGAELALDSVLGQGSTFHFTVTLPIADQVLDAPDASSAGAPAPLSVLVVDDNPTAREVLVAMALTLGWQVDMADSGAEAIRLVEARAQAAQAPYQAIFVDWQMPGMDGWETILRLRQISAAAQAPITVMVTAHGREMLSQRTAQEQARLNGFLVKPITASMLLDAVAEANASRSNLRARPKIQAEKQRRLAGLRLLVVEDNLINQQVAQELLSAEGALIEIAANGQLGVAAVANAAPPFDAVLMDIQMPVMDGYTATRAIRHELGLTDLPVIAMTANAMASDREACLAAGMNAHVGKPFDLPHLIQVLLSLTHSAIGAASAPAVAQTAVATTPHTAPHGPAEIPPRADTVDVDAALARLGGNTALYVRILQSYQDEIARLPDQLDGFLQRGDLVGATALLHTLKGLSATVGASHLAAVAKEAEASLKGADASLPHDDWHASFRAVVASTGRRMGQIAQGLTQAPAQGPPAAANPALDRPRLAADLRELQGLLKRSDMRAVDVHAQLRHTHAHGAAGELKGLDAAMAAFDFAQGVVQCETLIQQFSPSI